MGAKENPDRAQRIGEIGCNIIFGALVAGAIVYGATYVFNKVTTPESQNLDVSSKPSPNEP
jgi:hypothetical protein